MPVSKTLADSAKAEWMNEQNVLVLS